MPARTVRCCGGSRDRTSGSSGAARRIVRRGRGAHPTRSPGGPGPLRRSSAVSNQIGVILAGVSEAAVSIVIPAHNEEAVIAANLRRLLAGSAPGEFDVIVVANACSDGTAVAAKQVDGVRVIET